MAKTIMNDDKQYVNIGFLVVQQPYDVILTAYKLSQYACHEMFINQTRCSSTTEL